MANYSIVLNLRGSAVSNSKKLADNLERADKAAKSLKGNLQGIPNVPTGGRGGFGGGLGTANNPLYTQGRTGWNATFSTQSGLGSVYTFGKASPYLAMANIAARTLAVIGRALYNFNKLSYFGGTQLLKKGVDVLTSAQMGEGIRLLQRREQARRGFGTGYAEAQARADLLAASYGLDPSNVIASMNVLAGIKVGGRKISTAQAERLTQVGGLIAQASGQSFENVMVNIQQMMAQTVPSMRDIRQLLTHAPILSRYALQEMEKRGIAGDPMEFLQQNKGVMMSVFERYLSENPALSTMRARGIARQANVGFYASLAQSPDWLHLANRYAEVMDAAGKAAKSLLSAGLNSRALSASVDAFLTLLNDAPTLIDRFAAKLDSWLVDIGETFGIPLGDIKERAQVRTAKRFALRGWIEENYGKIAPLYERLGLQKNASRNEVIEAAYHKILSKGALDDFLASRTFTNVYVGNQRLPMWQYSSEAKALHWNRAVKGYRNYSLVKEGGTLEQRQNYAKRHKGFIPFGSEVQSIAGVVPNTSALWGALKFSNGGGDKLPFLDGAPSGEAVSGYGADRKSLVINFNAPIVEWDSTINADDPQDVVNTVTETIEGAASRAIQIALLGATGTMSSRY